MSISIKSLAVTAALGLAAVFSAGAAANAASPAAPAVSTPAHSTVVKHVQYRRDHRGMCSVNWARNKAARMGIRNARVVYRGRAVQVRGWRHGRPAHVTFANVRGCPTIR
ncbi:MAG: antifreeze protein [Rhizobiales bacterium]|nr:antifreeze protein [Hyphomicrobiales bacterium]OJY06105.1 MAG: antifreeze protein [Rhizobiales bacterium 63-22]